MELVVWGTSAMRTGGDDVAEALALIGVRPVGRDERAGDWCRAHRCRRAAPAADRRDAPGVGVLPRRFPHVIDLLNDAVTLAAESTEAGNPVAAAGADEPRSSGPSPGPTARGSSSVLESGNWRRRRGPRQVYLAWAGWAYGRGGAGMPAADAFADAWREPRSP